MGGQTLIMYSTLLGLDLAHCECMFWGPLRALQLRAAARVSHPTTAPMLHRVHYREGDLSPWCAARRETPCSSTLLAFFGGASGLMDVADTTTWQTSCACDI